MGKYAQTSINLRPDQMDYIGEQSINTSELLRKLLDQYMDGGDKDTSGLEFRLQELRQRRDRISLELEQIEDDIEMIRNQLEQHDRKQERIMEMGGEFMEETHEKFASYTPQQLARNNKFRDWALEHEWSVLELKQAYLKYRVELEDL